MTTPLKHGEDIISERELLRKVATQLGFQSQNVGRVEMTTAVLATVKNYTPNEDLLATICSKGFEMVPHPNSSNLVSLIDKGSQEPEKGYTPSNNWNFKRDESTGKTAIEFTLALEIRMDEARQGAVLVPMAHGNFVSATDPLPNRRLFKVLVDADPDAPDIARLVAGFPGTLMQPWSKLGFGEMHPAMQVFRETFGSNVDIKELAERISVFDPNPTNGLVPGNTSWYVTDEATPRLMSLWNKQLDNYIKRLQTR